MNSLPDEEYIYWQRKTAKHNANKWRRGLDPRDPDYLEDEEDETLRTTKQKHLNR